MSIENRIKTIESEISKIYNLLDTLADHNEDRAAETAAIVSLLSKRGIVIVDEYTKEISELKEAVKKL